MVYIKTEESPERPIASIAPASFSRAVHLEEARPALKIEEEDRRHVPTASSRGNLSLLPPWRPTLRERRMLPCTTMDDNTWNGAPNGLPDPYTGLLDTLITVPLDALANLQHQIGHRDMVIKELVASNRNLHNTIADLSSRMDVLEARQQTHSSGNATSRMDVGRFAQSSPAAPGTAFGSSVHVDRRSRSPSPPRQRYRDRDEPDSSQPERAGVVYGFRNKGPKDLQIAIPEKMMSGQQAVASFPTPLTLSAHAGTVSAMADTAASSKMPLTPGNLGPLAVKSSGTGMPKRGYHNLDRMVPPINVKMPLVPLTDTEIIVYFFNSLARPIVSLRLYANNWGPKEICNVINKHRKTDPPYLRNTCSVKCTTAIKKGIRDWGYEWETTNKRLFKQADPIKATDMIALSKEEAVRSVDHDIRALCTGLKAHPEVGVEGGIFTRCVQYCQEHDVPYKMSDVWRLASALNAGKVPPHPHDPVSPSQERRYQLAREAQDVGSAAERADRMVSHERVVAAGVQLARTSSFASRSETLEGDEQDEGTDDFF